MPEMHEDPEGFWNDEAGHRWVRAAAAVDRMTQPLTRHLLATANAQPGERVLDVGCGCGSTSLAFADAVGPTGTVVGVDISRPMLEEARRRGAGRTNLRFLEADAGLHDLSGERFDLLTSRFGIMFFLDPLAAFSNLRRALSPGGRVAFACWQEPQRNRWITYIMGAFPEAELPLPAADDGPGPFSLSDADDTRGLFERAGFSDVRLDGFEAPLRLGDTPEQVLEGLENVGPLARMLAQQEDDGRREAMLSRARAFLAEQFESGPPEPPGAIWMIQALNPG